MSPALQALLSDLKNAIELGASSVALVIVYPEEEPQVSCITSPEDVPEMFLALTKLSDEVKQRPLK